MEKEYEYTQEQLDAIAMFQTNNISILTGGPGTGKTTIIKEILKNLEGYSVHLAAPTGKAAKRMSEVTGAEATTIHRALRATMDDAGKFRFEHSESNPLQCSVLIVDELSMVTSDLMADLLAAVDHNRTRVLLVGDTDQLPSVGPGAVLRDLLASGVVPHTRLTKIQRNTGDIVAACHKIAAGQVYEPSESLDPEQGLNLRHIECDSQPRIKDIITSLVSTRMPQRGYNPMWDVQVLSPTNNRGLLSCESINGALQGMLNPLPRDDGPPRHEADEADEEVAKTSLRVNDKVINTKNMKIDTIDRKPSYIVNGDMGQIIEEHGKNKWLVRFFDPERLVLLPRAKNKLLLAYCVTCHRMQGSEAPVVIIPVHTSFRFFLNRPWIYTAISRAQDICITVGQFEAIEQSIMRGESVVRKTFLREKLVGNIIADAVI